ncbi:hypothetical protein Pmar_PMAR002727 [Perkinsus marinus ATCC 50983]|uniref:Endonuclease/exonuclease/phosphatase domain-containing protein n=1 Tax=Perkinsus marinus (strain ATCC 50983 / TXsc) TaxID=423536 RepID=C5LSA8_PERM5|nr:hypothetical protein Pmar_PMAR025560 [Perkinsus marinus ATCC 50983]XP_002767667.1 hypothetical protein Pmar_PMAR002727 [Perkinsus marinus ATCC 50983]EEQ97933.1 hypothetical protein Pmar_PMAR025560 [Perkinsus marinus ATCC 50983]EER00385.1 hypothetical protein Pmar_PMAR002727 [Perkinsus marinus ATCC 50983]|eukprot:XP_002765216.1 hypothetical protein Pmar_PMAR025560 [Perkinsus marinus ATCC 50983]
MSSMNSTNQAWARGSELLSLFDSLGFQVVNDPESRPTFRGGRGHSWIGVTAVRKWNNPVHWEVSTEESGSDHKLIIVALKLTSITTQRLALRLTDIGSVKERMRHFVARHPSASAVTVTAVGRQ